MARWGKIDFKELKEFQKRLQKMEKAVSDEFMEACAKELAARLLAKVIKRTPVGEYNGGLVKFTTAEGETVEFFSEKNAGKKGGTLRRGWTSGKRSSAKAYAESLKIRKRGKVYEIEIINPVEYASYVEDGHRTANHKGWVPGKYMLAISEQELDAMAPAILEKKLMKFLGELNNDK